ncbi:MAG: hypothetical protein ACRDTC_10120 [Pseudonocardiaceae bacterium]
MDGWAFLVARGRSKGYRTVLAPDFLVARNLHSLLSESAGTDAPGVGGRYSVAIDDSEVGQLSLSYRTERLRSVDLHSSDTADQFVSDEHGRPLEMLYGLVSRRPASSDIDERDLQRAREEALDSYRLFLTDENTFQVEASKSFPLRGPAVSTPAPGIDLPPPDHPSTRETVEPASGAIRPAHEVVRPPDSSTATARAGSRPARTRRSRIVVGGAALAIGAMLVALLVVWLLPDNEPVHETRCSDPDKLVGTITAEEPTRIRYHWEEQGVGRGRSLELSFETADEQQKNVEVEVPVAPGAGGHTGQYSLVIDEPPELRNSIDVEVRCRG